MTGCYALCMLAVSHAVFWLWARPVPVTSPGPWEHHRLPWTEAPAQGFTLPHPAPAPRAWEQDPFWWERGQGPKSPVSQPPNPTSFWQMVRGAIHHTVSWDFQDNLNVRAWLRKVRDQMCWCHHPHTLPPGLTRCHGRESKWRDHNVCGTPWRGAAQPLGPPPPKKNASVAQWISH